MQYDWGGVRAVDRVCAHYNAAYGTNDAFAWQRLLDACDDAIASMGAELRRLTEPRARGEAGFARQALRSQIAMERLRDRLRTLIDLQQFDLCATRADQLIRTMNACLAMMMVQVSQTQPPSAPSVHYAPHHVRASVSWPDVTPTELDDDDEHTTVVRAFRVLR